METAAVSPAALNGKVAALEDEMKIIKGEVKQILTEIRSAVLAKDNPFEGDAMSTRNHAASTGGGLHVVPAAQSDAPARIEPVLPKPEAAVERQSDPPAATVPATPAPPQEPLAFPSPVPMKEAVSMTPQPVQPPPTPPVHPRWSLLTVASLAAWAEEAMSRLGKLRLEVLLDLCEASGYLSADARTALVRVSELDIEAPAAPPSTTDTVVLLRQLDALLHDERDSLPVRLAA